MFKLKGIIAWIILGAICLVFALFGVDQGGVGTGSGGYAAVVNGKVISLLEVQNIYDRVYSEQSKNWKSLPAAQRQERGAELRVNVLNSLVQTELAHQAAEEEGLRVSNKEVMDWIVNIPAFQEDGVFQAERYEGYLRAVRNTAVHFESEARRNLTYDKVQQLFINSMSVLDIETEKQEIANNVKINFDFIRFNTQSLESSYKISSDKVRSYIEAEGQKVSDYYEKNKNDFKVKEQARARHILIKATPGKEDTFKAALKKVEGIAVRAQKEDFSQLAKEFSEDPGSKTKGGDLGYFTKGRMVKEFEEVAFSSPVGEISKPVRTSYGYHIIKVEDRKEESLKPLKEVETTIARKLIIEKESKVDLESFKKALKEDDKNQVKSLVAKLGLKWVESGEFSLNSSFIPKIGESPKVYNQLLGLKDGEVSKDLVQSNGQYYLLKMKSFKQLEVKAKKDKAPLGLNQFMSAQKAREALKNWLEAKKELAQIKTNNQFIQQ